MKKLLLAAFMLNIAGMASADINPGRTYRIASAANETRALFVENSALANNTSVVLWTDTDVPAQQWQAQSNDDGTVSFVNVFTGQYLSRTTVSVSAATKLRQTSILTSTSKWTVKPVTGDNDKYMMLQAQSSRNYILQAEAANDGETPSYSLYNEGDEPDNGQTWIITEVEPTTQFDATIREKMADAWIDHHLRDRGNNRATFENGGGWGDAEMLETMLDAYETTGEKKYLDTFTKVFNYFKYAMGTDWCQLRYDDTYHWFGHDFNDDVMWMIIASARAYLLTGITTYRTYAKNNFDKIFDRAYNQWGMLRWAEQSGGKNGTNSCINGPAEVAACYIAMGLTNESEKEEYYDIAKGLYENQRRYLFNAQTGEVFDSFTWDESTNLPGGYNNWVSTYNQGTMLGAAVLLYNRYGDERYRQDADRIVEKSKNGLCNSDGIVSVCQTVDGDLCGFKGILMRYLRKYIVDMRHPELVSWLQDNAFFAYNNRNSKGITSSSWLSKSTENMVSLTEKDGNGNYKSFEHQPFGNSTAVSAAVNADIKADMVIKDAWSTIEAEDCDYFRGIYITAMADGQGHEISDIENARHTTYNNVDFGSRAARTIQLRVGNVTCDGAKIEIHIDNMFGTVIGTAELQKSEGYQTVTASIAPTDGMRNICLVYRAGVTAKDCFTVDWFKFGTDAPALANDITDGEGALTTASEAKSPESLTDNLPTTPATVDGQTAQFTYISLIPATLTGYALTNSADDAQADPKAWTIDASNDGETWTTLDTQTGQTFAARSQTRNFSLTTDKAYTYFRLNITENNGGQTTAAGEWQLFGKAISVRDITADGGSLSTGDATVIDKDTWTYATTNETDNTEYTYNSKGKYRLTSYSVTSATKAKAPRGWTLYGYENANWIAIDRQDAQQFHGDRHTQFYKVRPQASYQNYKLVVDNGNEPSDIAEIQLFGHAEASSELYADITDNGGNITSSTNAGESSLRPLTDNDAATTLTLPFNGEAWVQYESPMPVKFTSYRLVSGYDTNSNPKAWTFEGSNDGNTWERINSKSNQTFRTKGTVVQFKTTSTKTYKFFRLTVTAASSDDAKEIVIGELQIHGTAVADNDMTDDNGTKTSEFPGVNDGENHEKLFDRTADSKYVFNYYGTAWMEYQANEPAKMNMYSLTSGNDDPSRDPKSWELQASDDGETWVTLDSRTGESFYDRKTTQFYTFDNTSAHKYYRLQLLENSGGRLAQLSEWQLFYSEKVATGVDGVVSGADGVSVSYNRAADMLSVGVPASATIHVFNVNGQVAARHELQAGTHNLSLASIAKGMYVVKVVTSGGATSTKIIK